jgi:endonuclease G
MLNHLAATAFTALLLTAGTVLAAPTECPEQFLRGQAPDLVNSKLAPKTRALCYSAFAVLHSGVTRTSLWSAEHLTRERIEAALKQPRQGSFHPEERLPQEERARLADYRKSGYDRGHLAPSGDMPDPVSMEESFSLANMVPQVPELNRGLWERIETAVRELAIKDGDLYVVTGPVFRGATLQRINDRVLVPSDVYKAVYDVRTGQAAAYLAPNAAPSDQWQTVSIADLQTISGIDVFPGLPGAAKATAMELPQPAPRGGRRQKAETAMPGRLAAEAVDSGSMTPR